MSMDNEYYFLKNGSCNVLFHRPTSKIAVLPNQITKEELNYEELDKKLINKTCIEKVKRAQYGKGKITLTYMASRTCNLACRYCFEGEGEFGGENCKPKQFSLESYVRGLEKALECYPEGIQRIDFFGGEPIINYKEIKKFLPIVFAFFKERNLDIPDVSMTTNATLLNDEIIDFIKQYKIRISISLDGGKTVNDQARKYKSMDKSVYDIVTKVCGKLEDKGVPYVVQATINAHHVHNFQKGNAICWIKEMEQLNYYNISIIPVETELDDLKIKSEEQLKNLDAFTREMVNYYLDKIQNGELTKVPALVILPIIQIARHEYMRSCTSGQSFIWDTDEQAYPCHMFCNSPEYAIGNMEEGLDSKKIDEILKVNRENGKECKCCIAKNVCSVWCKGIQFLTNHDMYAVCSARCAFQRAIVEECILRIGYLRKETLKGKEFWSNYKKFNEGLKKELAKMIH